MQHLSTAFLIIALVIVVNESDATVQNDNEADQVAQETKTPAVGVVNYPKYVKPTETIKLANANQTWKPDSTSRPPSKPPINLNSDKQNFFFDVPKHFYGQLPHLPPARHIFSNQPLKIHSNSVYNFPKVIPLQNSRSFYSKSTRQPLIFPVSTSKPIVTPTSPKFSLPVQTINGIRADFVRPPKFVNVTAATTTTTAPTITTTRRILRTKRIWPKRILEKMNSTTQNGTVTNSTLSNNTIDLDAADTRHHYRYAYTEKTVTTMTPEPTTRKYRRVTRGPSKKSTTPTPEFIKVEANDWVPIIPSHYHHTKTRRIPQTPISRRSDIFFNDPLDTTRDKGTLFLQSYGILPLADSSASPSTAPASARKKMVLYRKRKRPNNQPYMFSSPDLKPEESHVHPKVVTKIKHHHHHHHHRYIKTVEKKVPYKVEVPKPYPVEKKVPISVPVEKIKIVDRPYPVPVEKKVPYPVPIKIPQPIPVKVVEKEYVPKPYPIVHRVPVVQKVEVKVPVPVQVEKKVPYPVHVQVPVHVEKRVPYPVPVKVLVPQPYPVETRVPYPVEVKVREPVEVIRHVQVRVPYPQPYPVKVREPVPVPVEKRVPYPVEVEKKVPVPYEVLVPHKVEVEKKVPIYVPQPYPVEKKVPYPVRVPYPVKIPVKVPVRVPVEIPVFIHQPYEILNDKESHRINDILAGESSSIQEVTSSPQHSATVHGNSGFSGFQSRSDNDDPETTTIVLTTEHTKN